MLSGDDGSGEEDKEDTFKKDEDKEAEAGAGICAIRGSSTSGCDDLVLICDGCDREVHLGCTSLGQVPHGNLRCYRCDPWAVSHGTGALRWRLGLGREPGEGAGALKHATAKALQGPTKVCALGWGVEVKSHRMTVRGEGAREAPREGPREGAREGST